jgi:hypothetical protein
MFAYADAGTALYTYRGIAFKDIFAFQRTDRAYLDTAFASFAACTASAFAVFPAAFRIINLERHR